MWIVAICMLSQKKPTVFDLEILVLERVLASDPTTSGPKSILKHSKTMIENMLKTKRVLSSIWMKN